MAPTLFTRLYSPLRLKLNKTSINRVIERVRKLVLVVSRETSSCAAPTMTFSADFSNGSSDRLDSTEKKLKATKNDDDALTYCFSPSFSFLYVDEE